MAMTTNDEIVQRYTMEFWRKYDTKANPRVLRGMERISKDVVDTFHVMLAEALATKDQEKADMVWEIKNAIRASAPCHVNREYTPTDQMRDQTIGAVDTIATKYGVTLDTNN